MKVPKVLVKAKERAEPIVKNFEWTWTTAVVFSWGSPSSASSRWRSSPRSGSTSRSRSSAGRPVRTSDWHPLARDFVAANLAVGPFVTVVVIGAIMQNWRRKLRGGTADRPGRLPVRA